MSHLIQAIDIDGTRKCIKHGATTPKWRTESVFVTEYGFPSFLGVEDDDAWVFDPDFDAVNNNITSDLYFWTSCIWKATVRFELKSDLSYYLISVIVGAIPGVSAGIEVDMISYEGPPGATYDIVVDLNALGLMDRACGVQWDIFASGYSYSESSTGPKINVSIIDVTYGPPV